MVHSSTSDTEKEKRRYEVSLYDDQLIETKHMGKKKKAGGTGNSALFYLGYVGQVGFVIAIPIVGGVAIGSYIDHKWMTYPKMTMIGLVIGIIISVTNFVMVIKEIISGGKK